jgi:hypothetical protein
MARCDRRGAMGKTSVASAPQLPNQVDSQEIDDVAGEVALYATRQRSPLDVVGRVAAVEHLIRDADDEVVVELVLNSGSVPKLPVQRKAWGTIRF